MTVDGEEGASAHPSNRLAVLLETPDESGAWEPLVKQVAGLLDLVPSYLALPSAPHRWLEAVLGVASVCPAPVLVLPRTPLVAAGEGAGGGRLREALLASDDSAEAVGAARWCSRRLARHRIRSTVVLVLTAETAPVIWEGAGHNAAAWRAERVRRHGLPHQMKIVRGVPGEVVRAHCADADLVVLVWRQVVDDNRALVVRAVLDEGTTQPCLLLPLTWVEERQGLRPATNRWAPAAG